MNAAPSFYFNRKASIFTMWWKLLNITSSEQIDKQISFIDTKYELSIERFFFSILVEYTCSFVLSGTHDKTCLKESHISSYYLLIHLGLYNNIYPYTLDANNSSQTCSITDLLYFFLAVPHFLYMSATCMSIRSRLQEFIGLPLFPFHCGFHVGLRPNSLDRRPGRVVCQSGE